MPDNYVLSEQAVRELNDSVPKPAPPCPRCLGKGSYYEPPLAEQKKQIAAGTRRVTSQIVCDCYAVRA